MKPWELPPPFYEDADLWKEAYMAEKTQKQMIIEMYGTVQRLDERSEAQEEHLKEINGSGKARDKRIIRLEISIASLVSLLAGLGIIDASVTHLVLG